MPIEEAPHFRREFTVGDQKVVIDNRNMEFTEANLNDFMMKVKGWYSYYKGMWSQMSKILKALEKEYTRAYTIAYDHHKDRGMDVKRAEGLAKIDPDVSRAEDLVLEAEYRLNLIAGELRALDKAGDMAQSVGHNLRKELEKLNPEIYATRHFSDDGGTQPESRVAEMVRRRREMDGEADPLSP